MTLVNQSWYSSLIADVQSTWTEAVFTSRWALIEGYHMVGERLRQDSDKMPMSELLHHVAVDMGVSDRKLWYAVQFYDKYPDIQKLPDGKNITWTKIRTKYLPADPSEPKPTKKLCPNCGYEL